MPTRCPIDKRVRIHEIRGGMRSGEALHKEMRRVAKVEIYTKAFCGFCVRAKAVLDGKGVSFEEYDITTGGPKRQEMLGRSNGRSTVPQIFIDGQHIGGCDDLLALDRRGALDPLLA